MNEDNRILVVDDEKKIRTILIRILADEGCTVMAVESGEEALQAINGFQPSLILMDQNMPGLNGIETMAAIRENHSAVPVIFLTAFGSIPLAVEAMRQGAYDYLTKPFDNDELMLVVRRALDHTRLVREVAQLRSELHEKHAFRNIIGNSAPMQRLFGQMQRVCETNATVLIQGESGTGKELVARAIHYNSPRRDKPMVSVNCGAIPSELVESEFFGHEKGAFTDAKERRQGRFEQANGGTIFLDEVGELSAEAQVKLLRVLEDHTVVRIGGRDTIPVDVRVIAATNKDLPKEVDAGAFRLDLMFRLNVFALTIPPLRDRTGDIALLTDHFLRRYTSEMNSTVTSVSAPAIDMLQSYRWPGNVRDLENAIQSALIVAVSDTIEVEDLPLRVQGYPEQRRDNDVESMGLDCWVQNHTDRLEKQAIVEILRKYDGSRTETASALQVSRKTLFNKMRKYRIP